MEEKKANAEPEVETNYFFAYISNTWTHQAIDTMTKLFLTAL